MRYNLGSPRTLKNYDAMSFTTSDMKHRLMLCILQWPKILYELQKSEQCDWKIFRIANKRTRDAKFLSYFVLLDRANRSRCSLLSWQCRFGLVISDEPGTFQNIAPQAKAWLLHLWVARVPPTRCTFTAYNCGTCASRRPSHHADSCSGVSKCQHLLELAR